jgi:Integron cassette protein VCH_CASS1 chain
MARRLICKQEILDYTASVQKHADHHAHKVQHIIDAMRLVVLKRLNPATDKIEVYSRHGVMGNTCWITLSGRRYVLSYNYKTEKIELREGSTQGAVKFEIDNHSKAELDEMIKLL